MRRVVHALCLPLLLGLALSILLALMGHDLLWAQPALEDLGEVLASQNRWIGFFLVFLGGLSLNLTPCVYPMIPVTLAFFSGQASGRIRRVFALAAVYVLGMSLTYAVLGFAAAKTGSLLGSWLQKPWVLVGVAGVVVALAMSLFGWYELRPPRWVADRLGQASAGLWGALAMGLAVGLIAAPCIGPFVLGLLLFVGEFANPLLGCALFFTLGLGMGLPYLLLGIFANRIQRLPKAGAWLVWVKKGLGLLLIALAGYLVRPLVPGAVFKPLTGLFLVASGMYLGWFERSPSAGLAFVALRRLIGVALIATAVTVALPQKTPAASVEWQPYTPQRLADAKREGRPVIIDIYADWCLPCVELDHVTFRDPRVVSALSGFVTLRVDATREIPPEAEELLDRHRVFGVPTVLVFDDSGTERKDLRVTGFVDAEELLEILVQL